MNRDGIRSAEVVSLAEARRRGADSPEASYLLEHLVGEDFAVVLADFERLTRMNRDNDGDLIYVSRLRGAEDSIRLLRPPVHFKLQAALASQARSWSGPS